MSFIPLSLLPSAECTHWKVSRMLYNFKFTIRHDIVTSFLIQYFLIDLRKLPRLPFILGLYRGFECSRFSAFLLSLSLMPLSTSSRTSSASFIFLPSSFSSLTSSSKSCLACSSAVWYHLSSLLDSIYGVNKSSSACMSFIIFSLVLASSPVNRWSKSSVPAPSTSSGLIGFTVDFSSNKPILVSTSSESSRDSLYLRFLRQAMNV